MFPGWEPTRADWRPSPLKKIKNKKLNEKQVYIVTTYVVDPCLGHTNRKYRRLYILNILSLCLLLYYYQLVCNIRYWPNLPADWSPSIPCRPMHNCVLHNASISALKPLLILSLCRSIITLTVCLKCALFIWHSEYRTDASSRLNCSATEEFTSEFHLVGQMLRLLSFSGHFGFFWWNLWYREYLSLVPVIGCLPDMLWLSGSGGNGDLGFLTHCISTLNSFLAASLILSMVGAHSLPSCSWKNNCMIVWLCGEQPVQLHQKCNRWESVWNLAARLCGLLLTPSKRESWGSTQHHVHRKNEGLHLKEKTNKHMEHHINVIWR